MKLTDPKLRGFIEKLFSSSKDGGGSSCGGSSGCGSCSSSPQSSCGTEQVMEKPTSRRDFLKGVAKVTAGAAAVATTGCVSEENSLSFDEYFKGNFRLMTESEKQATADRLEKLSALKQNKSIQVSTQGPRENVLYGYAFNISKCEGYMDCVQACVEENNLDRDSDMQYIRMFESDKGSMSLESANGKYFHEVPVPGKFYMGVQCFHCENPPCVDVCPVGATWKEEDGIVVVDYDWCVGCRYCEAACPYWGRRFNWNEPKIPESEYNTKQHYLGNRQRNKGVMEKCTFCVQRSREGQLPACVDACPTGARIFGNLLDPNSEIRYVLKHKKVFRLKEELGTEPKFWYFMD